jgi:hypothetical protein
VIQLRDLLTGDADNLRETLESFVAHCLADAGVWSSPRESDGVSSYRVVERGHTRLRACGKIWEIDQTQHVFWVDVEWDRGTSQVVWTLFFDVDDRALTPRRARHAADVVMDPGEVGWRTTLSGRAALL